MRKIVAVVALASVFIALVPRQGVAVCLQGASCPPQAAVGVGPWIVGGIGLSALSVIVRASVVSNREHRELTSAEAIGAMALPFIWVLAPPKSPPSEYQSQPIQAGQFTHELGHKLGKPGEARTTITPTPGLTGRATVNELEQCQKQNAKLREEVKQLNEKIAEMSKKIAELSKSVHHCKDDITYTEAGASFDCTTYGYSCNPTSGICFEACNSTYDCAGHGATGYSCNSDNRCVKK